jgi:hypothetical protein
MCVTAGAERLLPGHQKFLGRFGMARKDDEKSYFMGRGNPFGFYDPLSNAGVGAADELRSREDERKFYESLRKKVSSGRGSYGIVAKLIGILIAVALIWLATKLGAYWTGWSPSERQTATVTEQQRTDRIRTLESALNAAALERARENLPTGDAGIEVYLSRLEQLADPKLDDNRTSERPQGVRSPARMFFPMTRRDIPSPCGDAGAPPSCAAVLDEYRSGKYGALRCTYPFAGPDRSNGYFFWWKEVPQNTVKMARASRKAAVKALGEIAVQHCPPTIEEAEALSLKNHQQ